MKNQTHTTPAGAGLLQPPGMRVSRFDTRAGEDVDSTVAWETHAARITDAADGGPVRRRLPDTREAFVHKFSIGGHEGYLTGGLFDDGTLGEIFVTMAKEGSAISGMMDALATTTSMALQHGVPLRTLCDKLCHTRFEPSGFTGNAAIPIAKSPVDYIFRYLEARFQEAGNGVGAGEQAAGTDARPDVHAPAVGP